MDNFHTIKDVLKSSLIDQIDKKRIMRCYEKVYFHYNIHKELPCWGNIDLRSKNKTYNYKVDIDKTIKLIGILDNNKFHKITFGALQEPVEFERKDFLRF